MSRPARTYNTGAAVFLVLATLLAILVADQWLKIHIKTNYVLGEDKRIFGNWFQLHFVENEGMAFGLKLGGDAGKILLTVFRLIASGVIIAYLRSLIKERANLALIALVSLVLAGALGNIIDSLFYGLLFGASSYHTVAEFLPEGGGYAPFLKGSVVDMLYFPLIDTFWPNWVPFVGGDRLQFFRPVFNIADDAISTGVIAIILFRNKLFDEAEEELPPTPAPPLDSLAQD